MEKIAVLDCRAADEMVYALENLGIRVIPTVKLDCLYDAVASHADIQIHYLGNNKFVCAPQTFEHYKKYLPEEFTLIKGEKPLGYEYPYDICYNTAALRDFVICKAEYTSKEILSEYKVTKTIINVNQGYSKCNICIVTGDSIITSDNGIAKAATEHGIDVLKIEKGHIELRNFDYGFIGGASGLINSNALAVNGDIYSHPDGKSIKLFCEKHGVEVLSLKSGILEDIGSIISNYDF
ncbi:MAG: hypothetical protein LIO53_08110 [Oscillospiraceae bacterium]|nr:hypothetical protein [Oscillospiraceae bacterium]